MQQCSEEDRCLSVCLSEVLGDIGANEDIVLKRRRLSLLREAITTSKNRCLDERKDYYLFGSQSEGTTAAPLLPDTDILVCHTEFNVVQDWSESQPDVCNLLMVQDDTTYPGYCMLALGDVLPMFLETTPSRNYLETRPSRDYIMKGKRMLLKHSFFMNAVRDGGNISGPAACKETPGLHDRDFVPSIHCNSWPVEARPWLNIQSVGGWPTEEMKRYCESTGCFVVAVSSKQGLIDDLEWRISTSLAERYLMFSLNITQIRCYVMMKMILKKFINPYFPGTLSSFMCKNVLFHCINETGEKQWSQSTLMVCLMRCLRKLQEFVREENCPHFIIPGNNLMARKISSHNKQKVIEILQDIIQRKALALIEIQAVYFGRRLAMRLAKEHGFESKLSLPKKSIQCFTKAEFNASIATQMLQTICFILSVTHKYILFEMTRAGSGMVQARLSDFMSSFTVTDSTRTYKEFGFDKLEEAPYRLLGTLLSSSLGSAMASYDIFTTDNISEGAIARLSDGQNSDLASGRLKLASVLYCAGDIERTESILRKTEEKTRQSGAFDHMCGCHGYERSDPPKALREKCNTGNEELVENITTFCVRFLPCEMNCIPKELQYEMFRLTPERVGKRNEQEDCWMDWAVVDSLPFLYFLQYKIYGALQKETEQKRALKNLRATDREPNLGHRETALNLLGQLMEQENRPREALEYYRRSLKLQARNNVAKIHLCRFLNELASKKK